MLAITFYIMAIEARNIVLLFKKNECFVHSNFTQTSFYSLIILLMQKKRFINISA